MDANEHEGSAQEPGLPHLFPEEWAAAGLLVAGGMASFMAPPFSSAELSSWMRFYEEAGVMIPAGVHLAHSLVVPPHLIAVFCGFAGGVGLLVLLLLRKRLAAWILAGLCGLGVLAAVGVAVLGRVSLVTAMAGLNEGGPALPTVPGRSAELAAMVERAVRESLARRAPVAAEGIRWVVLGGAGLPPLPADLPTRWEEARRLPGAALLPWGPPGSTDLRQEVRLHWPCGPQGAPASEALRAAAAGQAVPWVSDLARYGQDSWGVPVPLIPAVVDAPQGEGWSWALMLQRVRVDGDGLEDPDPGSASHPPLPSLTDQRDPFGDELLQVEISILRGFDPAAAATGQGGLDGAQPGPIVPRGNVPVARFTFLVALP